MKVTSNKLYWLYKHISACLALPLLSPLLSFSSSGGNAALNVSITVIACAFETLRLSRFSLNSLLLSYCHKACVLGIAW